MTTYSIFGDTPELKTAEGKVFAFNGNKLELRDLQGALQVWYEPTLAQ